MRKIETANVWRTDFGTDHEFFAVVYQAFVFKLTL